MDTSQILEILRDFRVLSLLIGILIPILLYWYSTLNYNYWKKRGIPFAKPYPFIGSVNGFMKKTFEELDCDRLKELGRIYGVFEGSKPVLIVSEPEHVRNILVKDFHIFSTRRVFYSGEPIIDKMLSVVNGEDWKRIRTIVSPTFTTGKIKRMLSIFQDCANPLVQNFKMSSMKGEPADIIKNYGAFTMDIIASSAFSTKIDSHNDPDNDFVRKAREAFKPRRGARFIMFLIMPGVFKKLGIKATPNQHLEFFKCATMEILEKRRQTGQKRNDFLQLLIDSATEMAKEEKSEDNTEDILANYGDDSRNHPVFKNATSRRLSIDELVSQCVIFFLAGYHTTATTLSLTTYLLALNEDVQDKVFKEIEEVLSETNGELKYESIQKMKYLDNVISEVLRLYSPGIKLERTAVADYKLGNTGITIPKGMVVSIPVFAMHRDPELFPEPEKFNPERFSAEEKEKIIPYSYLPFGSGPRNCVGMRFALVETKVCLVYVLSAFRVKTCSETQIPLEFISSTGLIKPKDIKLNMVPRENCPLKP